MLKRIWSEEELVKLRELCGKVNSLKELKLKIGDESPGRSWPSVSSQVERHSDWITHFPKRKSESEKKMTISKLDAEKTELSEKELELIKELQSGPKTLKEISEKILKVNKEDVFPFIDKLRAKGYEVEVAAESDGERQVFLRKEPVPGQTYRLAPIAKTDVKILLISDPCLGLRTQQGDLLATAYKIGEQEEVYIAIVAGNISAGKPKSKQLGEYFLRTFDEQKDYIISHWPKAAFKTHFINGPTDMTFKTDKGQNIGYAIAQERPDLYYRGDKEAIFLVGKDTRIAVVHIKGDDPGYTKSSPLQRITENYQEMINRVLENNYPPKVVLVGGTHSLVLIPPRFPFSSKKKRDICSINIPSLYGITPTQRARTKRGGSPVIGCWILTFKLDKDGNLIDVICDARDLSAYQRTDDYLEEPAIKDGLSKEQIKILELLREDPKTRGEICRVIHKSTPEVQEFVEGLIKEGYSIIFDEAEKRYKLERGQKKDFKAITLDNLYSKRLKTADFSDIHIGHKKSRWDLLTDVYRTAQEEKVDEAHFCGDIVEGPGLKHEQLTKGEMDSAGADKQRDFTLSVWPKSEITTKIISGSSHDLEYLEKVTHNFAKTFAEFATLKKIGKIEYIGEEGIWCRGLTDKNGVGTMLYHPSGGIPIGLTYRGQLNIEKLIPIVDEDFRAEVLKFGHLHIALFMQSKGVACLFVPCLQDQTQYLAAKGLFPWIGFWTTEVFTDDHRNVTRVVLKYFPYEPKKIRNNNHRNND